jgi:bifunctional non-homologous end joining protein LigD
VNAGSAIIDGEVVAPAADDTTGFSVLQNERRAIRKIVLVAFDLLYLNGNDLRRLALFERKCNSTRSSPRPMSNSAKASRSMARRC